MNEDYVSYELAKKLKACGFDEPCLTFYDTNKELGRALDSDNFNHLGETYQGEWFTDTISAPTLWQAQKWLREKHHISIRVSYIPYHKVWFADWLNLDSGEFDDTDATFDFYEEALADGIEFALELIKEGE